MIDLKSWKKLKINLLNEHEEQAEMVGTVETLQIIDREIVVRENIAPLVSNETHQPSTSNT